MLPRSEGEDTHLGEAGLGRLEQGRHGLDIVLGEAKPGQVAARIFVDPDQQGILLPRVPWAGATTGMLPSMPRAITQDRRSRYMGTLGVKKEVLPPQLGAVGVTEV